MRNALHVISQHQQRDITYCLDFYRCAKSGGTKVMRKIAMLRNCSLIRSRNEVETTAQSDAVIVSRILSPTGEIGSLPSITTPTELQVLRLLANEGPKSAPEIGRVVARSREHTARLMKKLYEEGYIRRDQTRIPFRYSLVDKVKGSFKKPDVRDEGKEQISIPQT